MGSHGRSAKIPLSLLMDARGVDRMQSKENKICCLNSGSCYMHIEILIVKVSIFRTEFQEPKGK